MATASSGNSNVNINNLNIITFIKDIYLSLKHIDTCFSKFKNDIDTKIIKLEGQYETILEKLSQLENSICQVNERVSQASNIDSALEKELLDKMYKLSSATEDTTRLELKPKEMTFANILENGYTMLDINNSLETNMDSNKIFAEYKPIDISDGISDGMSDGMSYSMSDGMSYSMSDGVSNNLSMEISMDISKTEKKKTLDSLLFD